MKKRIVILGAGISGLTLAWYLKKKHRDTIDIAILEKEKRVGGWIKTTKKEGFLFEQGPQSCRPSGTGVHTLQLIRELNLQESLIFPSSHANKRFLFVNNRLQALPSNFFSLLSNSLTRKFLLTMAKELFVGKKQDESDETVNEFFSRRFSSEFTKQFADPLTTGIYAGNIKALSFKSCFPSLENYEKNHRSIILGMMRNAPKPEQDPWLRSIQKYSLFSLKNGLEQLPEALGLKLHQHFFLGCQATQLLPKKQGIDIRLSNGNIMSADHVFSTLPSHILADLISGEAASWLRQIRSTSVIVAHVGYKKNLLKEQGFGYLIPTLENQAILGMIWCSSLFPQHNHDANETRLTLMLGGENHPHILSMQKRQWKSLCLASLKNHLGITQEPDFMDFQLMQQAIPQYTVGHNNRVQQIERSVACFSPHIALLGTSYYGVSVNDCIAQAKNTADSWKN